MRIEIPELCVVALVGATGSGKSTFAKKHFQQTEILSSDYFRGLVADDENDQTATAAAFDSLYYIANKRLDAGKLTVIDATNVQKQAREEVVNLAKEQNCFAVAIVLNIDEDICIARNKKRADRQFGDYVARNHTRALKRSIKHLKKEGFRYVYVLNSPEEAQTAEIVRTKLWTNKQEEHGPFDIIGDIHGCFDELCDILEKMGYAVDRGNCTAQHPQGRKAVFVGDLCDRGPKNAEVLQLVMNMCETGNALCVPGNHDIKLLKYLNGVDVKQNYGFDLTAKHLLEQPPEFSEKVKAFIDSLISHFVLDDGKLVVAHAGLKEKLQGRSSAKVRNFCLYGETTGETDEFGLPVRLNWAKEYRGRAKVVYGHTPAIRPQVLNNTVCIDTGCVFGGKLTAYRYPEDQMVQVAAKATYCEAVKPLNYIDTHGGDMVDITDVQGTQYIETELHSTIKVLENNNAAALEIMSRFSADPHWLIYLPPTMSPCETSGEEEYLEHPKEAFEYYKKNGVKTVVCEQKHMGSRAVIVLCKDEKTAKERFGVYNGTKGIIYTRTGRHFFDEDQRATETEILTRLQKVLAKNGFWQDCKTNWVCLDTELMPWSAKAQKLVVDQYAPVASAANSALAQSVQLLEKAAENDILQFEVDQQVSGQNLDLYEVLKAYRHKQQDIADYQRAYREYCWPVDSIDDYKIAPFHILATEGKVWHDEPHLRHLETIEKYTAGDTLFQTTNYITVDLEDQESVRSGINWWLELTQGGGEGMVVKPAVFLAERDGKLLQPAVKCRGKEYLRIIYGPEYTKENHLRRLKKRSLGKKRRLALNEFALGVESLTRFVKGEPLYRVHECSFAVLALESEPVDPRL